MFKFLTENILKGKCQRKHSGNTLGLRGSSGLCRASLFGTSSSQLSHIIGTKIPESSYIWTSLLLGSFELPVHHPNIKYPLCLKWSEPVLQNNSFKHFEKHSGTETKTQTGNYIKKQEIKTVLSGLSPQSYCQTDAILLFNTDFVEPLHSHPQCRNQSCFAISRSTKSWY